MVYSKRFQAHKYQHLASLLEKIQALKDDASLRIEDLSPAALYRLRWQLYEWLHHMELKHLFRLRVEGKVLKVTRTSGAQEFTFLKERIELPEKLSRLFEELLIMKELDRVKQRTKGWTKNHYINEEEARLLIAKWEEVME
jgi:hypothetical protein